MNIKESIEELQENQLTALPENITNPQNISNINVSANQLSDIPVGIENLQRLNNLDISNNHFINIPASLLNVNSLIELDLSENKIKKIVLSSNQALIWDSIRSVGYNSSIEGYGKLLRKN